MDSRWRKRKGQSQNIDNFGCGGDDGSTENINNICSFRNFNVFSFQYLVSRDNTMTSLSRLIYRKNALYDKRSMTEFCRQGRESRYIFDRMPVQSGDNCKSQKYFEWKGRFQTQCGNDGDANLLLPSAETWVSAQRQSERLIRGNWRMGTGDTRLE
jgi:hypothetical protein